MSKELKLIFDSEDARHAFYAQVLDCNILDYTGLDVEFEGSSDWTKGDYSTMRLKGTGEPEEGNYE